MHPAYRVPHRAELAVGVVVCGAVVAVDLREAMGFSSVCVLAYYAIANASAWTLDAGTAKRLLPAVGLAGCVALGLALPLSSVVAGAAVLAVVAGAWWVRGQASPDLRG